MPPLTSRFSNWLANTSIPNKYGLFLVTVLAIWLAYWLGRCCGSLLRRGRHVSSWRRLLESPVPDILHRLDISSYPRSLVVTAFLAANIIAICLGTGSWNVAQQRAGALAVIHLLPLCAGFTFSIPADICHLHRSTFEWLHRWLGRICAFHCLLHGTAIVHVLGEGSNLNSPAYVIPIVVSILICNRGEPPPTPVLIAENYR